MPDSATRRARPKVAVLVWDVGHNPIGRAYILADLLRRRFDVELWGAQFPRYGSAVWAPMRNAAIPVRSFPGQMFPAHLDVMERVAPRIDADIIWVSKPRLPSYALGMLAKEATNTPLVLDVDDHELAFFAQPDGLSLEAVERDRAKLDLAPPFGQAWTQVCEPLIAAADLRTVSNVALQERHGGMIVPHARDERAFDPQRYDRAEIRRRLGVRDDDRLLLFGGTARAHKGVAEVLDALERLGDDRYRIAVFETRELAELRRQVGPLERWLLPIPGQRFEALAAVVAAADLACVLQDPDTPVSPYQMPAKVTDALAMAVPCLVTDVPPLRPLIDKGVLHVFDGEMPLEERIGQIFEDHDEALDRAQRGRELFLDAYSYEAVREAIEPVFEGLLGDRRPLRPELQTFLGALRSEFREAGGTGAGGNKAPAPRVPGKRKRTVTPGEPYDLVIFWKQNDTSIYGRRQDMFLKYLEQTGRFATIVHFDRPITLDSLLKQYVSATGSSDQSRLVVRQSVGRLLHLRDRGRVRQRTFLYNGRRSNLPRIPKRSAYIAWVKSVLTRNGIGNRPLVLWAYPTNDDLPMLIDALDPDVVVADVVDDNRTWYTEDSPHYARHDLNYERVLARSDVVLANCPPVAESMRNFAPDIHVVPNACDVSAGLDTTRRPRQLRGLRGPLIGYVGNLSARIDIALLETVARARPEWQFVFVGSAHADQSILRLDALPNVHFLGVKPYQEAQRFVAHFDVALIPHLDNDMTRSMNPLKAYVYFAAGVPVVSTPIANLGQLADLVTIAEGPEAFVSAIEAALKAGKRAPDLEMLGPFSWPARVEYVMGLVDSAMGIPPRDPASHAPTDTARPA